MHGTVAREKGAVAYLAVSAQQGAVGQEAAITDVTIVGHMGVGHEVIVAADPRGPGMRGAPMHRHMFAENIVLADLHAGWLVLVVGVLRPFAEDGAGEDRVARSHCQRTDEIGMRLDDAAWSNLDAAFDDCMGSNLDVIGQIGLRRDQRRRMDSRGHSAIHASVWNCQSAILAIPTAYTSL